MSSESNEGRRRRIDTSSDFNPPIDQPSTSYKYRAGVPALPMLPLQAVPVEAEHPVFIAIQPLLLSIQSQLQSTSGFQDFTIELVYRIIPGNGGSDADIFLLVRADWVQDSESTWLKTAINIKEKLVAYDLAAIGVEIIAPQLWRRKYMTVVESNHPFVAAWNTVICDRITKELLENTAIADSLCALNVIRLGYENPASKNDITILVTVNWSMNPIVWSFMENRLQALVEEMLRLPDFTALEKTKIVVCFENGENLLFDGSRDEAPIMLDELRTSKQVIDNVSVYAKPPYSIQPGVSVGVEDRRIDEVFRTIGPILKISGNSIGFGAYALTNYHGFASKFPPWPVGDLLRSPALKVADDTLKKQNNALAAAEKILTKLSTSDNISHAARIRATQKRIEKISENIATLNTFQNNGTSVFGTLQMGSVCRMEHHGRIDVALIRILDDALTGRSVSNQIPGKKEFHDDFHDIIPPGVTYLTGIGNLSEEDSSDTVFKTGAITGPTAGTWSTTKSIKFSRKVNGSAGIESTESGIIIGGVSNLRSGTGNSTRFADHGDSGAAVWNAYGEWIGLVWGGTSVQQTVGGVGVQVPGPITYITPAEDIVKYIKAAEMRQKKIFDVELY